MNRLANETSPYLRQHRDNPVDWFPWGAEATAEATRRDRPILLSVGYSACHWCHVMAHECFEDGETAALMNELFVNVKVDREERSDVDALYMDAVQAMTGRGGWPMTVFLRPDGEPFYGGTYFPREQFHQLLRAIDDVWVNRRHELQQNVDALRSRLTITTSLQPLAEMPGRELIAQAYQQIGAQFDRTWGGFGKAPKFPSTMTLELIIRSHHANPGPGSAEVIGTTLDAMASGAMFDHIGGGFARYSTDEQWLVPHFEKMLSDQALLIRCYVQAWQLFDVDGSHARWLQIATESIEYVLDDLGDPLGGLYSAHDADSLDTDGTPREGAYYGWTLDEVRQVCGDDAEAMIEWYAMSAEGNFEGRNLANRLAHRGEFARPEPVERARQRLAAARRTRPQPGLDDKVITEWNALMLSTLAQAASATGRADWLSAAVRLGEFLVSELRHSGGAGGPGRYARTWQRDGGRRHDALAADYAALIDGYTRLAEATGEARWVALAAEAADYLLAWFWDTDNGGLFTVAENVEQLIVRQKELFDNATPSANSAAAVALYRLGTLLGEQRYVNLADQIVRLGAALAPKAIGAFSNLLLALGMRGDGLMEIVIAGDRPDMVAAVQRRYLPNAVVAWGERYESPLWEGRRDGEAYVCRNYTCAAPCTTVESLLLAAETPTDAAPSPHDN